MHAAAVVAMPRAAAYASFLPDTALIWRYGKNQFRAWKIQQPIKDQWNRIEDKTTKKDILSARQLSSTEDIFNPLAQHLMGIKPW